VNSWTYISQTNMKFAQYYNPLDLLKHLKLFYNIQRELFELLEKDNNLHPNKSKITHARHGSIKFPDAYIIKLLLDTYKPQNILEVGSFLGFSTRWLLELSNKWNAKVSAVDPNIRHRIFDNPRDYVQQLNSKYYNETLEIITAFFGELNFDIYKKYRNSEPKLDKKQVDELLIKIDMIDSGWNRNFDFIFIDGDHSYKSVISNFEVAFNLVNKGGCIVFHDVLSWNDVRQALEHIENKYTKRIKLEILGNFERYLLKLINKSNDGIALIKIL